LSWVEVVKRNSNSNSNSNGNGNGNSNSNGNSKCNSKGKSKIQGFFAALRMTGFWAEATADSFPIRLRSGCRITSRGTGNDKGKSLKD
jgi:hypothetical protein